MKNEQVKEVYQIAFDKDFYCVETHGKAIACNGLLFNNVHRASVVTVSAIDKPLFQSLVQQMIEELETKRNAHKEMVETYLRQFLIRTLRLVDKQLLHQDTKELNRDRTAEDFIAQVEKHFRTEHTVGGYAEKLFITSKSLAKRLHAQGYPTPLQIIKDRLVLEAKRQLKFTNKSVKEIAFELGFDDPAYFSRLFSKNTGVAPSQFKGSSR